MVRVENDLVPEDYHRDTGRNVGIGHELFSQLLEKSLV